jgi:murein DD-endopeptidase MepM/ murein hydrolase activator NlpD
MPTVPREYRHGVHEGVDFFTGFSCVDVPLGLPVVAPADGTVIRADQEYKQPTQRQIDGLLALTAEQGYTDPGTLDKFRGRQVGIDHGDGIVTRYAHLSDIPQDVQVGTKVTQGQVVAFVGDSGTPESLAQSGYNKHLHFEIRVGDSFLGAGLPMGEVRALYEAVFGLR